MNRLSRIVSALVLCVVFCACGGSENKENPTPGPEIKPVPEVDFAWGADIGWVSEMEKAGMRFTDSKGGTEIFSVLKNLGMNSVRLRVWVNPLDANGWSGKDDVVAMAKRAASAGMAVMIDFHYSDFFADPSYQDIPSAWPGKTAMALTGNVASHTTEVLTALKEAGVTPQWIQIGNETRNGMLWPAGQLWTSSGDIAGGWNNFEALYMSGYNAAKAIFPNAAVMPHLNHAYEDNEWWFSKLKAAGGKFDMIALSHYPMSDGNGGWQALNTSAVTNIKKLAAKFGVKVVVSEFGVKQKDSQAGQCTAAFMDAVKALGSNVCSGIFYWEPEVDGTWKPAVYSKSVKKHGKDEEWNAYDMGAFTRSGSTFSPNPAIL
jgi:arabinogalactan endo-1,4-beta-galactosidase